MALISISYIIYIHEVQRMIIITIKSCNVLGRSFLSFCACSAFRFALIRSCSIGSAENSVTD